VKSIGSEIVRNIGRRHTAHARSVNSTIKPKNEVAIDCPQVDEYNARSDDTVPINHPG